MGSRIALNIFLCEHLFNLVSKIELSSEQTLHLKKILVLPAIEFFFFFFKEITVSNKKILFRSVPLYFVKDVLFLL